MEVQVLSKKKDQAFGLVFLFVGDGGLEPPTFEV
jgi:hypothetical protein